MPAARFATALVGLVLLAGCTAAEDPAPVAVTGPTAEPAPAPSDDATNEPVPDPTSEPETLPPPRARGCSDEQVAAMDTVVAAQLAAMAVADWDAALEFASTTFRASVDAPTLERIILDGFPVVAANVAHEVLGCLQLDVVGQLRVEVTAGDATTRVLDYRMELEDDGWRIAGAVPEDGAEAGITV